MGELCSVFGDKNTHGDGALLASTNPGKFFINGKKLVTIDSTAEPDDAGHDPDEVNSAEGSNKFFAFGKKVHRHNDARYCDAKTIVSGQSKFTAGG